MQAADFHQRLLSLYLESEAMVVGWGQLSDVPDRPHLESLVDTWRELSEEQELLMNFRRARAELAGSVRANVAIDGGDGNWWPSYHDWAFFACDELIHDVLSFADGEASSGVRPDNLPAEIDFQSLYLGAFRPEISRFFGDIDRMQAELQAELAHIGGQSLERSARVHDYHDRLDETEQKIVAAINGLWSQGEQWPQIAAIARHPEAGLEEQTVKSKTGPMYRHYILDKGPNGRGFKVRT